MTRMIVIMADVNTQPTGSRRDRALATRRRIIETAVRLFTSRGYAATTMDDIAAAAGVAVQTVYYTFRTKGLLLREAYEFAGAGEPDAPPVDQREWMRDAMQERSGDRALAVTVEHGVDIFVRAASLWPAVGAATLSDPDVEEYSHTVSARRRAGMGQLVNHLEAIGYLRDGMDVDRGTAIVCALFSHDTFLAMTRDAGWSTHQYKAWLWRTLRSQLADRHDEPRKALDGLSFAQAVSS